MDAYSQILVNRILTLCRQRDISIYRLSVMSGVNYSTLDNFLKSKTFNPKVRTLQKIANAFNMTMAEFFDFPELNNFSLEDAEEE